MCKGWLGMKIFFVDELIFLRQFHAKKQATSLQKRFS